MAKLVVWVCLLVTVFVAAQEDLYELNIIHFNDFHAHFEEISPSGTICNPSDTCIGGYARLFTAIREAREAEPDSLVLNGGDTFQGTIWYNFLRWNVSQHFMNLLPHDAHVLGNHEFDHGPEGLVPYLERLNAPMLGANVNTTFEPELTPYVHNHVVLERRGRRIGIIGVLLRVFSAPMGGVIMEDEVEAINREAAILEEQGVDIIIVLSHCGYTSDVRMAAEISSSVDMIVGAHSHTLLYNGDSPNGDSVGGDYPTPVVRSDGHRILVVQASCYTRYLGNIKLFIDDAGIIQGWEGVPIFLGSSIVQDPQMMEELEPWRAEVDAVGKEVLGRLLTPLSRSCYSRECNIGSWACDGFLQQLMERAKDGSWNEAHVCLINAGGLRAAMDRGEVTTEGLLMAMPFENYVQVYDLKGEHLLEALEFSVGVSMEPGNFYSGRMLQVGGLRVVYNASQPVDSRVVSAAVRCVECAVPRYLPLDPGAIYRVVTQNYIGDGGGGYTMLSENRENLENLQLDYVMLQQFLRHQGAVLRDLDGRIEIVF
ncbi:apyrase-like isoform X1 [Cydia strobilella]|uniref:apyrase-like isoform X1 n=1 Tax=Cydia strobilella TaxID=1100964 RepID=UPI0030054EB8